MNQRKKVTDIEVFNGKLPPSALDVEEVVLGMLMIEKDTFHRVESILHPDDFYKDAHKEVFKSIQRLSNTNRTYDIVDVTMDLRERGMLEISGGPFGVTTLTDRVAGTDGLEGKAKKIKEYAIIRKVIHVCSKFAAKGFEPGVDAFELVNEVLGELEGAAKIDNTQIQYLGDIATKTLQMMREAQARGVDIIGLPSSISSITAYTMGYSEPDLITLAAGTGEGKTTFAFQEAFYIAYKGHPVAFICMEMKGFQLCWKLFSSMLELEIIQIRLANNITDEQWDKLEATVKDLQNVPMYIVDATGQNINQITALSKEFVRKYKIKMLFVDYLQLISGGTEQKFGNREVEVSYVSRKLKENCMSMSICTMALSQLSRLPKGTKRTYELSDIRESGAIEQNSDGVVMLYWPHYHKVTEVNGEHYTKNESIFIILKWRLGGHRLIRLIFFPQYNRFKDPSEHIIEYVATKTPSAQLNTSNDTRNRFTAGNDTDEDLPF